MKSRPVVLVVLLIATSLLSGCILLPIPHEQWLSPRFQGTVIDAESARPLGQVKVTLRGYSYAEDEVGAVITRSDANGHYSVLASRRSTWTPIWLGPAEGLQGGTVTFEAEGYLPAEVTKKVFTGAMSRAKFEVNVQLKKKPPHPSPVPTPELRPAAAHR
jgi:hypothetical protein